MTQIIVKFDQKNKNFDLRRNKYRLTGLKLDFKKFAIFPSHLQQKELSPRICIYHAPISVYINIQPSWFFISILKTILRKQLIKNLDTIYIIQK